MAVTSHYFIAIPVPSHIKEKLVEWQQDLKKELTYKQWTSKDDFHITLKFLGAVQPDTVKKLMKELSTIEGTTPFSLDLNGIQTFGNPSSPRVLFANVQQSEPLIQLVDLVETCADMCAFEKEKRPFRGHITLAKKWAQQAPKVPVESIIGEYQNMRHTFSVDKVHLFQIHPTKCPKYEVIESFHIKVCVQKVDELETRSTKIATSCCKVDISTSCASRSRHENFEDRNVCH